MDKELTRLIELPNCTCLGALHEELSEIAATSYIFLDIGNTLRPWCQLKSNQQGVNSK